MPKWRWGIVYFSCLLNFGVWTQEVQANDSAQPATRPAVRARLTPRLTPRPRPAENPTAPPTQSGASAASPAQPAPSGPSPAASQARSPAAGTAKAAAPTAQDTGWRHLPPPAPRAAQPLDASDAGEFRPPLLPAYKALPPPAGYVLRRTVKRPLIVTGAGSFVALYSASIAYGASEGFQGGLGALAVPVLGPWIALGTRNFECEVEASADLNQAASGVNRCIAAEAKTVGLLVGLGIGQVVGGALLAAGLIDRKKQWVRADLAGLQIDLSPQIGLHGSSLVASGVF